MPVAQRLVHIEGTNNPIFGRTQWQLDERRGNARPIHRQQRRQTAGDGGLSRSPLALDEHAADRRIDSGQQQCQLQVVLADDGGKRIFGSHLLSS